MAASLLKTLFSNSPAPPLLSFSPARLRLCLCITNSSSTTTKNTSKNKKKPKKFKEKQKPTTKNTNNSINIINDNVKSKRLVDLAALKRRTRSDKEFDEETVLKFGDSGSHIPVMLGEVLEVFGSVQLKSFVDCTLGAAGHSSAIIQAHSEMQLYVGMDVDPVAHEKAQARINEVLQAKCCSSALIPKTHIAVENFMNVRSVLSEVDKNIKVSGIDGILMDLGMSSMQVNNAKRGFSVLNNGPLDMRMNPKASLKAEDILNSWPDTELGRILREYGEESNWRSLQHKIVKARLSGGLHSTGQLVDLIRSSTFNAKGGRQGWIKTATRVFQALRIAVNDELRTLEESLHTSFNCLAPGGRLAVISFHSLEDRIVKQTFLNIISANANDGNKAVTEGDSCSKEMIKLNPNSNEQESWIRQMIKGQNAIILTKRPITPSEEEEKLNVRSRSAKLRVIQKV